MRPARGATALAPQPFLLASSAGMRSDLLERLARTPTAYAAAFALVPIALFVYWPLGIVVGVAVSLLAVLAIAARVGLIGPGAATADAGDGAAMDGGIDAELAADVRDLRERLGEDFADFARAALHVVESRRASIAAVQRGLGISANRSRALLRLLEAEGFVGPSVSRVPRTVLVEPSLAPELRALFDVPPEPAAG